MNTNLVTIVKQIITDYGEAVLADPQRLKAFFSDLAKDEPKPLRVAFGRCIEEGAYNALKTAPDQSERAERKAVIAQRVHDEHGLDMALCGEAMDILEAALYDTAPAAYQQPIQQDQPQSPSQTTPAPVYTEPSPVYAVPENVAAVPASAKKHTLHNVLIAAGTLIVIAVGILLSRPDLQPDFMRRPVELNEYDQIIFTQKKNNDELVMGNLALTLRDVKAVQKFIREKFPAFDFEEAGYVTDDYRNELLAKEFNTNPEDLSIYLGGIAGMAGKSQVYADLGIFDDELLGYYFSIDQEFSDTSGFEYYYGYYPTTSQYDGKITSIQLGKFLYTDTNESYWVIIWDDDVPLKNRLALLKDFLNSLRYTKVFKNFARDFLKDVYTGIEKNQTIEDIVDWWKTAQSAVPSSAVQPAPEKPVSYTEEIYIESLGRLQYTLSNDAGETEKTIYAYEGKRIDLNRLNVNYSYPWGYGIVNNGLGINGIRHICDFVSDVLASEIAGYGGMDIQSTLSLGMKREKGDIRCCSKILV